MTDQLWTGLADLAPDERFGEDSGGAYVRVFAIAASEYEFAFAARRVLAEENLIVVALEEVKPVRDVALFGDEDIAREVLETGEARHVHTFHAYAVADEE